MHLLEPGADPKETAASMLAKAKKRKEYDDMILREREEMEACTPLDEDSSDDDRDDETTVTRSKAKKRKEDKGYL